MKHVTSQTRIHLKADRTQRLSLCGTRPDSFILVKGYKSIDFGICRVCIGLMERLPLKQPRLKQSAAIK